MIEKNDLDKMTKIINLCDLALRLTEQGKIRWSQRPNHECTYRTFLTNTVLQIAMRTKQEKEEFEISISARNSAVEWENDWISCDRTGILSQLYYRISNMHMQDLLSLVVDDLKERI